jgi:hypothetical protein
MKAFSAIEISSSLQREPEPPAIKIGWNIENGKKKREATQKAAEIIGSKRDKVKGQEKVPGGPPTVPVGPP